MNRFDKQIPVEGFSPETLVSDAALKALQKICDSDLRINYERNPWLIYTMYITHKAWMPGNQNKIGEHGAWHSNHGNIGRSQNNKLELLVRYAWPERLRLEVTQHLGNGVITISAEIQTNDTSFWTNFSFFVEGGMPDSPETSRLIESMCKTFFCAQKDGSGEYVPMRAGFPATDPSSVIDSHRKHGFNDYLSWSHLQDLDETTMDYLCEIVGLPSDLRYSAKRDCFALLGYYEQLISDYYQADILRGILSEFQITDIMLNEKAFLHPLELEFKHKNSRYRIRPRSTDFDALEICAVDRDYTFMYLVHKRRDYPHTTLKIDHESMDPEIIEKLKNIYNADNLVIDDTL
jgi:hypothetical protein